MTSTEADELSDRVLIRVSLLVPGSSGVRVGNLVCENVEETECVSETVRLKFASDSEITGDTDRLLGYETVGGGVSVAEPPVVDSVSDLVGKERDAGLLSEADELSVSDRDVMLDSFEADAVKNTDSERVAVLVGGTSSVSVASRETVAVASIVTVTCDSVLVTVPSPRLSVSDCDGEGENVLFSDGEIVGRRDWLRLRSGESAIVGDDDSCGENDGVSVNDGLPSDIDWLWDFDLGV
jgi:hypothetical protein